METYNNQYRGLCVQYITELTCVYPSSLTTNNSDILDGHLPLKLHFMYFGMQYNLMIFCPYLKVNCCQ